MEIFLYQPESLFQPRALYTNTYLMKNIVLLSLLLIIGSSCKKKRNCSCTTSIFYSNGASYSASKTEPMTEKMSEKQAKAVCDREAENINTTYNNYHTNNGNYPAKITFNTNCILK